MFDVEVILYVVARLQLVARLLLHLSEQINDFVIILKEPIKMHALLACSAVCLLLCSCTSS